MKHLIEKSNAWIREKATALFRWMNAIPKDKYQHFCIGTSVAAAVFILTHLLCPGVYCVALGSSVVAVALIADWKDCCYDQEADIADILATIAGGVPVWLSIVFILV